MNKQLREMVQTKWLTLHVFTKRTLTNPTASLKEKQLEELVNESLKSRNVNYSHDLISVAIEETLKEEHSLTGIERRVRVICVVNATYPEKVQQAN